jgi:hypothetical protein
MRLALIFLILSTPALAQSQTKDAEAAMRERLRDPQSARFEDLRVVPNPAKPGAELVCGFVNAKGQGGGYLGKTPFVYAAPSAYLGGNFDMISGPHDMDRILASRISSEFCP